MVFYQSYKSWGNTRRKRLRCASDTSTLAQTERLLFIALIISRTQGSVSEYINIRTRAGFRHFQL
jgi:hypothetical protein